MDHIEWIKATTKGDATRAIGRAANIPDRTVASQIDRGHISAENVIAIAIAYGVHPVTALIDCGYLPARYATTADPVAALRSVSEDDLADEVLRRMKLAGDHTVLTTPVDELLSDNAKLGTASAVDAATAASIAELKIDSGIDNRKKA
ncbi:lambda repressor-like predicted transcriptional regulator [Mycobacterium frederiksbergense]|uniref:Lambda repressor-like predicted transcriptional regulator n=1 Tax=Mycolicibacterium frederiksbergense TaxID=117567 RepID=A0ABT6L8L9_9MYCO|nr:hypothetical protein [Mycolicibacterium frederiksbergense]MDH6199249.1 lambda repressor-like predicted transcriptional regulator [Mycolicibacterium frederiksbergense]